MFVVIQAIADAHALVHSWQVLPDNHKPAVCTAVSANLENHFVTNAMHEGCQSEYFIC